MSSKIHKKIKYLKSLSFKRLFNFFIYKVESKLNTKYSFAKPLELDIVPTKNCNLDCIFCIKYPTIGDHELSLENFKKISKTLFPYSLRVRFCSGGEPFLNKNMREFLTICQNYKISTILTTNGTLLTPDLNNFLVSNKSINQISISFDGATKETLESIRRKINFEHVVKNIKNLSLQKKKIKNNNLSLVIRFAAMKKNIHELPLLIKKAKQWGINEVHVNYLNVANDIDKSESLYFSPKIINKIFTESKKIAKRNNITLVLPPSINKSSSIKKCLSPRSFLIIDTNGNTSFCYKSQNKNLGNFFKENNFNKIWNSNYLQKVRKTVNTKNPYYKYCSICSERNGYSSKESHINKT